MSNPQDPRTPQERAYSLDEAHDGTVPDRTVPDGTASDPTSVLHTSDPTAAYGRVDPTQALPPYDPATEQYQQYSPTQQYSQTQQYPPTQQYPQTQQYQQTQQFGPAQQQYQDQQPYQPTQQYPPMPPSGYGPGGPVGPPTQPPAPEPGKPHRRWLLPAAGVLVVLALAAIFGYLLGSGGDDGTTTASAPTTTVAPAPTTTRTTPPTTEPALPPTLPLDRLPGGIGDAIGSNGTTVGTVTGNDGTSITVSGIGGSIVTVRLTSETRIISLAGSTPDVLKVGDTVIAQGTAVEGGEMTADTVVSATVPGFGRSGN